MIRQLRNEKHLAFIRQLPCTICGNNIETEACHIRYSDARYGKHNPGVGRKPDDKYTVPLCGNHHREQHSGNEQRFWKGYGIDPIALALGIYSVSGDIDKAEWIIKSTR